MAAASMAEATVGVISIWCYALPDYNGLKPVD